ncbi:MAG: hypothetical protein GC204_16885 [Chloroflexi bacterium]|nr:hypothetical protein [Chloroflexota bacterium]
METVSGQPAINFRLRLILTAGFAVIVLALYVWAFFAAESDILNLFGIISFILLMLCPILVAYQTVRLCLQAGTPDSVRDSVRLSLSHTAGLLLGDALIAVPIFTLLSLFLQIEFEAFFGDAIFCGVDPCLQGAVVHTENFIPQTILVLVVALGLWGLNLLACVIGAALALRWGKMMPATSGTILALVVTVAVIYAVLSISGIPQIALDLVATVLPYLLVYGAWRILATRAH